MYLCARDMITGAEMGSSSDNLLKLGYQNSSNDCFADIEKEMLKRRIRVIDSREIHGFEIIVFPPLKMPKENRREIKTRASIRHVKSGN